MQTPTMLLLCDHHAVPHDRPPQFWKKNLCPKNPRRPKNQKGPARSYAVTTDFTSNSWFLDVASYADQADSSELGMALRRLAKKDGPCAVWHPRIDGYGVRYGGSQ